MLECEVNSCSDESRCEDQAGNLDGESHIVVWVRVHDNSSTISDCFSNAAQRNGDAVEVGSLLESETKLCDSDNGEDRYEKCTGSEIWLVAINCILNRTSWAQIRTVLGDLVLLHFESVEVKGWKGS